MLGVGPRLDATEEVDLWEFRAAESHILLMVVWKTSQGQPPFGCL